MASTFPPTTAWLQQWNPFNNLVGQQIGIVDWPPKELYEALSIAQHHGVPTRLLDFTYDPLIAAFFASEKPPEAEAIAVWCVDLQMITLAARNRACPLEIITVPRFRNRNLAAQKALFLLDLSACQAQQAALETCIARHVRKGAKKERVPAGSCAVRKFCLPASECGALRDVLRKLGVDRAHLMPSFDGVVRELEFRRSRRECEQIPIIGSVE